MSILIHIWIKFQRSLCLKRAGSEHRNDSAELVNTKMLNLDKIVSEGIEPNDCRGVTMGNYINQKNKKKLLIGPIFEGNTIQYTSHIVFDWSLIIKVIDNWIKKFNW